MARGNFNYGGGAYISATIANLTNNMLIGNTASGLYSYSGGSGGGAYIPATTVTLTNNTITGNMAKWGGGLNFQLGNTETIAAAKLYNNLFWDNVADANQGADLLIDNDGDGDFLPTPVTLLANNFDQANPTGFSITLTIDIDPTNLDLVDPLFVAASTGDFHLQSASPMIDAGYSAAPNLPATDAGGGLRVVNGVVDIGAYEYYQYESCDLGPLVLSGVTFDAGGDHHVSEVSITTEGVVEILAQADVLLRAPTLRFGPGFSIARGAEFMAIAGPVTCNQ